MPFATDRRDKMFTASNLNNLYARFDEKCRRVLSGKSPLFANSSNGVWEGPYPYGVWYVYRGDPEACKRLRDDGAVPSPSIVGIGSEWQDDHTEVAAKFALSKLENKHLDPVGRQVYVDHWSSSGDPFTADIAAIHYSFELHTRDVDGEPWDVHLGWDPPATVSGVTSYVRGSLGASTPTLPPGRIHKHRLAVAEIALEGVYQFRILRTYQRYDCWRVHNCGSRMAEVLLQNPDGSANRQYVAPGACRAFRRRPDGTWAITWPGGNFCHYFFPFFTGDIPFFAEGPPSWSDNFTTSPFLALERSAVANNVANPFILFEWLAAMEAVHDPFIPYDIRQVYSGVYADPMDANTTIGDAVFTWGRARIEYTDQAGRTYEEFRVIPALNMLVPRLEDFGIDVTVNATDLTLSTTRGTIRIYPADCNIFTTVFDPYWEITATPVAFSTIYPAYYTTENYTTPGIATWNAGNEPTIFDTMRNLRRKIAVEVGFLNTYTDVVDIVEEKVSVVTMTPMGLMCRASTATGIGGSQLNNYEATATNQTLWIADRPVGFGAGPDFNFRYTSGTRVFYLQPPNTSPVTQWANVVPARNTIPSSWAVSSTQAVNCAFIPPGGPWGFSSSVYDLEVARVYEINPATSNSDNPWGADFWENKWGGPGGADAFVRIPGSPNKTMQYAYTPTEANASFTDFGPAGRDDIFKDQYRSSMASTVPLPGATASSSYDSMTEIKWTGYTEATNFKVPYSPVENWTLPGGGPFFHKIPKSAWLWNLLEWSVRAWTRAVPLCLGQTSCPVYDAAGSGTLRTLNQLILGSSGRESGGTIPSWYINEPEYDILIANGIVAYKDQDAGGNDYWYVPSINLATFCDSQGFTAWDWSTENGQPNEATPVAATGYDTMRNYGDFDQVQVGSYYDVNVGYQRFETIRFINLRIANELAF